jgi:hypothetical protein
VGRNLGDPFPETRHLAGARLRADEDQAAYQVGTGKDQCLADIPAH